MSPYRPLLALLACMAACAPDRLTRVDAAGDASAVAPAASAMGSVAGDAATAEPHFLRPAAGAPTIANPVVSFWAKRGVRQTAEMVYHRVAGARDSVVFFSLRLKERSLWRRPDGTAFADGDSVLITLTLVDAGRGIVDCQPSGLRFSPVDPVRLRMSFFHADDDLNRDGVVNAADSSIARGLDIWRRESAAEPWQSLVSKVAVGPHEVEAEIGGFTGYAIAW